MVATAYPEACAAMHDVFRNVLASKRQTYTDLLKAFCDIECGSEMVDGVNQAVDLAESQLNTLGLSSERIAAPGFGDHLVATTGVQGKQIVLGGHLDTTYTDYGPLPAFHIDGQYAVGPGTSDMKGGVVVFIAALDCLRTAGLLANLPVTVVLNTDEERGAPTSRDIFGRLAERAKAALFSECGGGNNDVVVSRRAKLSYRLDVRGVGAHAAQIEGSKVSALVELGHKVIAMEALNDGVFPGASFNVGRAWGGIASNTVPEQATALVDIRYPETSQEGSIRAAMEAICERASVPGSAAELVQTSFRPAWQKSDANAALFELTERLARQLGQSVVAESRLGTADSSWFGALGIPCLDGLGPVGFADHTPQEKIVLETLFERALLVAALLAALGR